MDIPKFLQSTEVFLLDLDGTLYLGNHLIRGAKEFIELLEAQDRKFLILTNNSARDRISYQQKLERLGVRVSADRIFTSGDAALYALTCKHPTARVYVAGTNHLKDIFRQSGFKVVERNPDVVVLGFDSSITYAKLRKTCNFVRQGLPYYATHPDLNCPVENGFIPDTGATIAFIAASTGRQPDEICGKPFPAMVEAIGKFLHCSPEKMAMIGDRLNTDIAMGSAGIRTILVFSGETHPADLAGSPYQPDLSFDSIADLYRLFSGKQK